MRHVFAPPVSAPILALVSVLSGCAGQSAFAPPSTVQVSSMEENASIRTQMMETARSLREACGPVAAGHARCLMFAPAATPKCTIDQPPCYGPTALRSAYGIAGKALTAGKGVTVALVDAYGYPTAKKDLALYREKFHLPKLCSTCFEIVNQAGGSKLPTPGPNWEGEQALDVDMVSAICPNCRILLVESNDDADANLFEGVATALKRANVVSNSGGFPEIAASAVLFDKHPGKLITAASGDYGYLNEGLGDFQPCSFTGVVCVGGTSLYPRTSGTAGWIESVWDALGSAGSDLGTGSGCSALVPKPAWQHDRGCTMRSATDVSAVADPSSGVMIALNGTCCVGGVGGTSAATPIIAAMFALAGNTKTAGAKTIWRRGGTNAFSAVTTGNNGTCPAAIEYMCTAGTNMNGVYSGPTGWGTPNGLAAL
jgi:subtilase family serine protease